MLLKRAVPHSASARESTSSSPTAKSASLLVFAIFQSRCTGARTKILLEQRIPLQYNHTVYNHTLYFESSLDLDGSL